ncbi:Mad3/BUB1 homology region 1 domain containing protein [Nitzschia inconspicua]|uniref:Mad3/BUB1 homology region 1 domain containing protein n=1 Tax=Nitzschia inconspicua TaxID=303405 RepID=A0A9K3LQ63_9STRA|nr:Mad3/BUB1 homology region 1 domain containing protein [Nitzschia inconspicua]
MSATPAWEQSKENAAPLERGRNVASIGIRRFSQEELNAKIQQYEETVRPTEAPHITEMEGDPLIHWLAYIKFYQATFPADTRDNFLLMERCVRALVKMEQYANDERFIAVCAKYADKTKDPSQVFKYLHHQKVGVYTALFWIAWAFVAEKDSDFVFAEQVFKKGISKQAQPLQMLKMRHSQFQRRMSRHWLNSSRSTNDNLEDEYDDEVDGRNQSRSTLGGLSRDRLRRNDRGRSSRAQVARRGNGIASGLLDNTNQQSHRQQKQQQQSTTGSFSIFVDQEDENGYNLEQSFAENDRRVIAREAERKKENDLQAEQWNQRGGMQPSIPKSSKDPSVPFSVFVDEECAIENERQEEENRNHLDRQRQVRDDRTFRERDSEGMAETLRRDPLRYVRDPSQLEAEVHSEHHDDHPEPANRPAEKSRGERKTRTGFNKRLLKNKYGKEQCFEEARALAVGYRLVVGSTANFNFLHKDKLDDQSSQMELEDEEGSLHISMAESTTRSFHESASSKQPFKLQRVGSKTDGQRLFQPSTSFDAGLNQTAISNASSTVNDSDAVGVSTKKEEATINTKLAMRELSMMFSSPAFGVDERKHSDDSVASKIFETSENSCVDQSLDIADDGLILDNSIINHRNNVNQTSPSSCRRLKQTPISGVTIFEDEAGDNASPPKPRPQKHGMSFQIYEDDERNMQEHSMLRAKSSPASSSDCSQANRRFYESGDTVSVSEAMAVLGDESVLNKSIAAEENAEGDTATLSLFNEIFRDDGNRVCNSKLSGKDDLPRKPFEIFIDEEDNDSQNEGNHRSSVDTNDSSDGALAFKIPSQRLSDTAQVPATEYKIVHDHDVVMSLRRLQTTSTVTTDNRAPLSTLLVTKGQAFHLPSIALPKQLCRKRTIVDAEISVGKHSGIVRKELGRGAYGIIFLMDIAGGTKNHDLAIKVQSPTDSLAWEFEILKRLESRFPSKMTNYSYSFPRPFSIVSLADGGIMSMSAASKTGLNLVDLSNFYKLKLGEMVPEVVAMHYTSITLRIVEELHWHGMVLHCDVKPDNFVLTSYASSPHTHSDIPHSDLMLVDFGRAIDLRQFSRDDEENARNLLFFGEAATKEMQCVAMRTQRAWSYDVDTYGILCCAHVLLYGRHMEIVQAKGGRWRLRASLKRYWQQDLWNEIFDTLLNLDDLGTSIGSRSSSLRALRRKIETYLSTEKAKDKLRTLLTRQAGILPDSREKIEN